MLLKGLFYLCIQAMVFESIFTQCIPSTLYPREQFCPDNSPFEGYNLAGVAPSAPFCGRVSGGNIVVDTLAPDAYIGPAGVTIVSDNLLIEGAVSVSGNLPFVGTVGLEGVVPAVGNSVVSYECGTRDVGIVDIQGSVTEVVLPTGGTGTLGCGVSRL